MPPHHLPKIVGRLILEYIDRKKSYVFFMLVPPVALLPFAIVVPPVVVPPVPVVVPHVALLLAAVTVAVKDRHRGRRCCHRH